MLRYALLAYIASAVRVRCTIAALLLASNVRAIALHIAAQAAARFACSAACALLCSQIACCICAARMRKRVHYTFVAPLQQLYVAPLLHIASCICVQLAICTCAYCLRLFACACLLVRVLHVCKQSAFCKCCMYAHRLVFPRYALHGICYFHKLRIVIRARLFDELALEFVAHS